MQPSNWNAKFRLCITLQVIWLNNVSSKWESVCSDAYKAAVYEDLLRTTTLMLPVSPIKVCKICRFFQIQEKLHNEN